MEDCCGCFGCGFQLYSLWHTLLWLFTTLRGWAALLLFGLSLWLIDIVYDAGWEAHWIVISAVVYSMLGLVLVLKLPPGKGDFDLDKSHPLD